MFKKKFPSLSSLGSDGNTAFLRAARAGNLDKVLEHLKANIDINTSNSNGLNALHLASKDGHIHVVTELLKRGASVDAATKKGNTALHIASLAGQEEVVKLLVANGAAVNVQSQNGFTPLYMAAQENHDSVVRFLLANGANQSLATEDGFTPLAVAMQQGHDKVVAVLLENDTRGKVRLPALHIAAKKDDCKAAALLLQNDHNPDVTSKSGFTPLHIAAHYGNENIANLLLNRGADVNYAAKHNITPLHVAAKWGKTNMVSLLLEKGANIESKTRDGLTPLHCAARSGHEQVVDMLLERGAPISSKTKNGLAPLHMASQGDHVDAARILLYHRAPVDEVTVDYLTALHVAAHCGHVRVAKLLLDRKADPNARALNGFTPLHIACKKNRIKVVELLLKHGASIEATTESGLTPLHVASFMGCMNIVIYLLQHDANPDVPTVRGETPLHLAARANQTDIIRILLRNGAQVDARAREQQTPLHIASRLGNVDIVMLLLQHGAAVDSTTKDLYTALHIAAKEGQEEVASVLLEHGASPTATTKKGFTPLHLAAKYGNMKVAKLLLQRDAPVDAQGKNGVTPLHVASHYDHQNVALLLLDKGASPHATAKNGHTPLHIAARKNQMDIATTLLEFGAKANAESKAGFTPLHLSSQEGHTDMSTLLIEHQADIDHKAKNGLTPLHLCAQEDQVNVAAILVKNGAEIDSTTKAGYTPLHVASHFGQSNMVRFLLQHGADVKASTSVGYTPLHQAAQQGHATIVNLLLENGAQPNALTSQGQSPLSIAQKLGYISVVESLKVVTDPSVLTNGMPGTDEKYRVVAPETMQETFMSDSEDEGGEDTMLSDQPYRYLTVDEMKSLGDDSLPIDVTRDERIDSNRETMAPPTAVDDTISPQHTKESYQQFAVNYTPDNIDISRHPIHVGFLVSFLVDARGGAMRGCRHSGVRLIVPPRKAAMPTRVTCRYLKRDKLTHPPPLMEGEALASRILELGPVGAKFLGPVVIEVPHFGSLRGMEREIVILRSDNGEMWREHTLEASDEAVQQVLSESFEGEELNALEEVNAGRTTRILTTDFPQYFAVVSRIRQEVHAIGPEGGMVSSSVVPQVQAVFPQGALTKKIKVGLQAQPIPTELTAKLLGNRVAVSPIVTVEPRRRKFHKPITLTLPVPQAANKGMINQYSGDAPTLRLLCSITGGTTRAQWEDVTGSTPLTFVNDCVSFTTTVSARFWLMDCRNIGEATKMATELYKEAMHVPFMAKFVVFAKRVDQLEARLRVFCMTDDKEDKTLENQEQFTEVAKSRDVEVLEGKPQYVEFAGNLVPVTKSGDQLQLGFRAFRENRLPFTVRVKDPHADTVGRILFMREPKVAKGEPPQQPICILNIVLPETIMPESGVSEPDLVALHKKYSFLRDGGLGRPDTYQRTDLRLSDISNLLGDDWVPLAAELGITTSDVNSIKSGHPGSVAQQAMAMLRLWLQQAGNKATGNMLETALRKINREDIVQQCIFNVDEMDRAVAKARLDQSGFESLKEELGPSRDTSLRRDASLDITYDEQDIMKDSESVEELVLAEKKEPYQDKKITDVPIIAKKKEEKQKTDIDETKYIGEEKVVEEERRSVAELKEIFAQDKRDRQYERQPRPFSKDEDKEAPPLSTDDTSHTTITTTTTTADGSQVTTTTTKTVEHIRRITGEVPERLKDKDTSETIPSPPKAVFKASEADQRRDSELFQGVTEELARLETTYKVTPAPEGPEVMSPKVSKTPPPSPAEFKDSIGVMAWHPSDQVTATTATTTVTTTTTTTTTTATTTRVTTTKTTSAQSVPSEDWTGKSQDQDSDVSQGTLEHGDDSKARHHDLPTSISMKHISAADTKQDINTMPDIKTMPSTDQLFTAAEDMTHSVHSYNQLVLPFPESIPVSAGILDLPLHKTCKQIDVTQEKTVLLEKDITKNNSDVDLDVLTAGGKVSTLFSKTLSDANKDITVDVILTEPGIPEGFKTIKEGNEEDGKSKNINVKQLVHQNEGAGGNYSVAEMSQDSEVSQKHSDDLQAKEPCILQNVQTTENDKHKYMVKETIDTELSVISNSFEVIEKGMKDATREIGRSLIHKQKDLIHKQKETADLKEAVHDEGNNLSQMSVVTDKNFKKNIAVKGINEDTEEKANAVTVKVDEMVREENIEKSQLFHVSVNKEENVIKAADVSHMDIPTERNVKGVKDVVTDVEKDKEAILRQQLSNVPQVTKDAVKDIDKTTEKGIVFTKILESAGRDVKQSPDLKGTSVSRTPETTVKDVNEVVDIKANDLAEMCDDAETVMKSIDKGPTFIAPVIENVKNVTEVAIHENETVLRESMKKGVDKKQPDTPQIMDYSKITKFMHASEDIQKDVTEAVSNKDINGALIIGPVGKTHTEASQEGKKADSTLIIQATPQNYEGVYNSRRLANICEEISAELDNKECAVSGKYLPTKSDCDKPEERKLEDITLPPTEHEIGDITKPFNLFEVKTLTQNFIDVESVMPDITKVCVDHSNRAVLSTTDIDTECEHAIPVSEHITDSSGNEFDYQSPENVEKKQAFPLPVCDTNPADTTSSFTDEFKQNEHTKHEDVTLKKSKIMLQDMDDIAEILKEIAEEQPISEQVKESFPVVTTPTTQRRGTQSMRFSKEKRPPPLDVTHLMADEGDDDDDDDYDSYGYVVTEPSEGLSKKSGPKVTHVSSSPDILASSQPLSQTVLINCASKAVADPLNLSEKRKPMFQLESEEDEITEPISSTDLINLQVETLETQEPHQPRSVLNEPAEVSELAEKVAEQVENEIKGKGKTFKDSKLTAKSLELDDHLTNLLSSIENTSEALDFVSHPPELDFAEKLMKDAKTVQRVERRFERVASETLNNDAIEGSTPEVEQRREDEFQRMVSQLSTEEVDDFQKEYSQLWDEGGLTPSEDWESRDPDTPSGELDDDTAPNEVRMDKPDTVAQPAPSCKAVDLPKIIIDSCETASTQSQDDEYHNLFELYFTPKNDSSSCDNRKSNCKDYKGDYKGPEHAVQEQTDFDKLFENVTVPNQQISNHRNTSIGNICTARTDESQAPIKMAASFMIYDDGSESRKGGIMKSNAEHMALDILEEALAESIILQNTEDSDRIQMIEWMLKDVVGTCSGQKVKSHELHIKREPCSVERSPLGDLASGGWDQQQSHHDPQASTPARASGARRRPPPIHDISIDFDEDREVDPREHDWRFHFRHHSEEEDDAVTVQESASTTPQTTETTTRVVSDDGTVTTTTTRTTTMGTVTTEGDDNRLQELLDKLEEEKQTRH